MKHAGSIGLATLLTMIGIGVGMAQTSPPPAGTNTGTAQEPGKQNEPKTYKPSGPSPDPRSAPTSTPSGEGPSNGGRPEQEPSRE